LALWHYTIWLPDRFYGGIVGAFLASLIGAVAFGLIVFAFVRGGFAVPGLHSTHIITVLYAVPGALLGMVLDYWLGACHERNANVHIPDNRVPTCPRSVKSGRGQRS
jgi:membrane protein DedA with SNARE-associated domain